MEPRVTKGIGKARGFDGFKGSSRGVGTRVPTEKGCYERFRLISHARRLNKSQYLRTCEDSHDSAMRSKALRLGAARMLVGEPCDLLLHPLLKLRVLPFRAKALGAVKTRDTRQ